MIFSMKEFSSENKKINASYKKNYYFFKPGTKLSKHKKQDMLKNLELTLNKT